MNVAEHCTLAEQQQLQTRAPLGGLVCGINAHDDLAVQAELALLLLGLHTGTPVQGQRNV